MPNEYSGIQTPCFIFDESELRMNMLAFNDAVRSEWPGDNVIMGFSVKTAPVDRVIALARDCGYYAEVVSDDEFALALKAGYEPENVVFNGPIKTRDWLYYALDAHAVVNLDSQRELDWVVEYAKERGAAPSVGLRINFDLESRCPGETVAGIHGCRFGYCVEDGSLAEAVDKLRGAGIEPVGLHGHFSNSTYSTRVYKAICDEFVRIAEKLHLTNLRYLDLGGGYYGGGSNIHRYYEYARAIADGLSASFDPATVTLIVEPGGSILCTAAEYCGKVLDIKEVRGRQFVITELSKLNMNSTVFYRMSTACTVHHEEPKVPVPDVDDEAMEEVAEEMLESSDEETPIDEDEGNTIICGYTCMEMDRLSKLDGIIPVSEGDIVTLGLAGAYTVSLAPGFFIQNPPAIYLRKLDGSFELICGRETPVAPSASVL